MSAGPIPFPYESRGFWNGSSMGGWVLVCAWGSLEFPLNKSNKFTQLEASLVLEYPGRSGKKNTLETLAQKDDDVL